MKKFYLICAYATALISMALTGFGAAVVLEEVIGKASTGAYAVTLAAVLAGMACTLFVAQFLNYKFDHLDGADGKVKGLRRWAMNILMADFQTVLVVSTEFMFAFMLNENHSAGRIMAMRLVPAMLGARAIYMYVRNYDALCPRPVRVRKLVKQYCLNKDRRFVMGVTEVTSDGRYIRVRGTVDGKVRARDRVLIHTTEGADRLIRVRAVDVRGVPVKEAENCIATLTLSLPMQYAAGFGVKKFAVMSSVISARHASYRTTQAENPGLTGLLAMYGEYHADQEYMSTLIYELMNSTYILAGVTVADHVHDGDMMDALPPATAVNFPGIFASGKEDAHLLAVFTDWHALSNWKSIMKQEKACTMTADLKQVLDIVRKDLEGAVINPFGPRSFLLTPALLNMINQMDLENRQKEKES